MSEDGILGLDFLRDQNFVIDVVSRKLVVWQDEYTIHFEGLFGCFRIVASEKVSIPTMSEMIMRGKLCVAKYQMRKFSEWIVEPIFGKSENKGPFTSRSVVKTSESGQWGWWMWKPNVCAIDAVKT